MATFLFLFIVAIHTVLAKVSPNFNDCFGYFYNRIPPVGFESLSSQTTHLCQMYGTNNNPFFASLYDKGNRSPLYSAYILDRRPGDTTGDSQTFRMEPQLVDSRLPDQMMTQPDIESGIRRLNIPGDPTGLIKNVQAINSDYTNSNYHKGHLNPNADHPSGDKQLATYTLTNVAPMLGALNSGAWRANEMRVREIAETCSKMFVITGVVPGNNWIQSNRVNIPSHIWSAYCCLDNNGKPRRAEGSIATNDANQVTNGLTITNLQTQLANQLGKTVTLFDNNCQ